MRHGFVLLVACSLSANMAKSEESDGQAFNNWVSISAPGANRYGCFDFHVWPDVTRVSVAARPEWVLVNPVDGIAKLSPELDSAAPWVVEGGTEDKAQGFISHCVFPFDVGDDVHKVDPTISLSVSPPSVNLSGSMALIQFKEPAVVIGPAIHELLYVYGRPCVCGNSSPISSELVRVERPLTDFSVSYLFLFEYEGGLVEEFQLDVNAGMSLETLLTPNAIHAQLVPGGELVSVQCCMSISGEVVRKEPCEKCSCQFHKCFQCPLNTERETGT